MRLAAFFAVLLLSFSAHATRLNDVTSVFSGNLVAGDPYVVQMADGTFRMSYTDADVDPVPTHPLIGTATSPDGLSWTQVVSTDPDPGIVLRGRTSNEAVETSAIVQTGAQDWLMYVTTYYTPVGDYSIPGYFIPAEMYLLISNDDGLSWSWWANPVIGNTPGWYTNDGVYSASIIWDTDRFVMAYNAFCYYDCSQTNEYGAFIMIAESFDGINWTLKQTPAIGPGGPEGPSWMYAGVEDPSLVNHNGQYLLFFGGDSAADTTSIGMAYSDSLDGPWTIVEEPIVTRDPGTTYAFEVRAASVVMEGDDVRMWFVGALDGNIFGVHHGRAPLSDLLGTPPPCTCP